MSGRIQSVLLLAVSITALSQGALAQGLHPMVERDEEAEGPPPSPFGPGFSKQFGRGLLVEKLRSGTPQDQIDAARELGRRQDERAVPALLEMLEGVTSGLSSAQAEAIIEALGEIGDRRAVPALLNLLSSRGALQRASIQALGRIGDERALDPIADLLSRPSLSRDAITALLHLGPRVLMRAVSLLRDPATAGPACELLGRLGDHRALWPMVSALASPRARVRRQCSAALGHLGDPRAQRALFELLQDPDASVRRRALSALVLVSDGSMGPVLAPLLMDEERGASVVTALRGQTAKAAVPTLAQLASGEASPTQQEAIAALGRIGGPEAAAALDEIVRSPRADVRFMAATSLAKLGPEQGLPPLVRAARTKGPARVEGLRGLADLYRFRAAPLFGSRAEIPTEIRELAREGLDDASGEVVGAAVSLVGALGDGGATDELTQIITESQQPVVRASAVKALGALRTSKACPIVINAMADRHEGVRAAAVWTAGELGCGDAGPLLLAVLERGPDGAAGNAAWALGAVGFKKAAPILRQRLAEGGPALRANASLALAALGDYRAGAIIRGRINQEPPSVRAAMVAALGRLGGSQSLNILERLSTQEGIIGVLARDGLSAIRRGDTLRPPTGSEVFRTRIVNSQGEPLPGLWFTLALSDRRHLCGITDSSGEITVERLPDGPCVLGLGRAP